MNNVTIILIICSMAAAVIITLYIILLKKDTVYASYWFSNGWHMNSTYRSFKVSKSMSNEDVIALARTKCGWDLSMVRRNDVWIYG